MENGMLKLNGLTPGNYTVNVTYLGNDNYSGNCSIQKFTIKEDKKESSSGESSSTGNSYVDRILNDPSCHVI